MYYIGIDLGGTNVAAAAVDNRGTILAAASIPTPRGADLPSLVADTMALAVRTAVGQAGLFLKDAAAVGIGSPGTISPEEGIVRYWSNLDFYNVPICHLLLQRLPEISQIYLENDGNAAALGEFVAGGGKGSSFMLAITLGTGVGGGAVLDGTLYTGFNYAGMEIGHFVLQKGGRLCTCGRRGCFEAYCSATAMIRSARERMEQCPKSLLWRLSGGNAAAVNGRTVFDAAGQGDPTAQAVLEEYTEYLGDGVTSLVNILQPEVVCIGGGIAAQGETLLAPVREILAREDYARGNLRRTRLVKATLGNHAGIIGAALLPNFR